MAPTLTVHYTPTGGSLSALVRCGFANPGSYGLTLLGPGATTMVQQWKADFGTVALNTHVLGAASDQNGRVLDVIASVGLLDPTKSYSVFLTVIQDEKELGTVSETGTGTGLTKLVELIVMLSGATAVASIAPTLVPTAVSRGLDRVAKLAPTAVSRGLDKVPTLAPTAVSRGLDKVPTRAVRRAEVKESAGKAIEKAKEIANTAPVEDTKKKNTSKGRRLVDP